MAKTFLLSNGVLAKIRKHKRAKQFRLSIEAGGNVFLTLPFFVSFKRGQEFLESKAEWIMEKTKKSLLSPKSFLREGSRDEYELYKEKARELILDRIRFFQTVYPFPYERISIRHTETRWGSCSEKKNLNYSYRLFFLPERLRDYVIVHELCHLKEMNHSKRFWALVAQAMPRFRELRKELKSFSQATKTE